MSHVHLSHPTHLSHLNHAFAFGLIRHFDRGFQRVSRGHHVAPSKGVLGNLCCRDFLLGSGELTELIFLGLHLPAAADMKS